MAHCFYRVADLVFHLAKNHYYTMFVIKRISDRNPRSNQGCTQNSFTEKHNHGSNKKHKPHKLSCPVSLVVDRNLKHPRCSGTFRILREITPVTYKLYISEAMRERKIHDSFHVRLLKPLVHDQLDRDLAQSPPILLEEHIEW